MIAGSLEIELMANVARLQRDMQQARATVDNTFDAIGRDVGRMKALLGTLFMGVSVGNLLNAVNEVKEAAVQVDRLAAMSRSSTDDFQKMASGAKSVGIDMSKFGDIMKDVQDKVGDFLLTGEGELKDFFETIAPKVGVTAEQFRKLSGPDALQLFYTSLEKAGVGQMVMINQMEAIADEASALAPLLANNGAELKRLGDEAQRTGAIMSTELITASKNLDAEIKQLQGVMTGITNTVMTGVMPALASMADAAERDISAGFESTYKWVQANRAELDAMLAITQSIDVATWEILAPIGEILVATGKWSVESGVVGTILITVGLLIAGLKDGVTLVGASFISVGGNIQNAVLGPIADFVHGLGTIMQMTGASDMGATFISAAGAMKNMGVTALQYVADVEGQFLRGDTAVARFRAGLQDTATSATAAAKSTKSAYDNLGTGAGISAKATEEAKKAAEKAAAAAKKLAEDGKKLAASLLAEDSGLSGDFSEKWAQLSAAYKAHSITLDVLTQAQARMLSQQPAMKAAAEAEKKAQQEAAEAYAQTVDDRDKSLLSIKEEIEQERQAIAELGMSKEAIVALTVAKLEEAASSKERRAALADEFDWSGQLGATYRAEAKALRDLAVLKQEHVTKEIATDAAKETAEQWKRGADQIETSLTDALMRGFGHGGSFAQGLADEAERVFESMVLRPTFAAASRPVAGAITNAIGSFGNPANGQAGSGILGSVASSAIGTAITSGFAEVAAGYSGATIAASMVGPSATAVTGLSGLGSSLAAVPGWGWALAGAAALMASGVGGSIGEVHSGGIYSTSSPANMTTAMRVTQNDSAAARDLVDRANEAVSKPLEKVGKGLVKTFDDLAKMLGTASDQFDLTLGFAADLSGKSKDKSAFGYFDLVDKATGETLAAYKNRNLGENSSEAMTKLTNDASRAMLNALAKADIPAWAEHALGKLADLDGLDALAQFAAWPKTLLAQFGADRDSLVQKFAEGLATTDAATAGQNVALSLVSSIEQTVMTAGAGQIFDTVNVGIITPMLDALATGASVSEALSQSSIDAVVQKATAQAQALNAIFTNVDFKAALDQIKTAVGTALGSAGAAMNYQPTYWKPETNKVEQSAAEKAAEDLAKRIKDALDGLKTDGLSLQIELLRAQGNDAAAAVMELNKATEGWDAASRELYRQRLADNAAVKEQIRAQNSLNALREESGTLAIQLLRAQGQEEAALAAERKTATKLMTDAELGVYDYNRALERQIAAEESLGNLRNEGATLSVNLMRALEQNEQALSREREIAIAGMSALEVAQYDANKATETLIDGISKIKGAFDTAKSSLNLGGIPSVGSVSTTGLTQAGALEANIKNLQTYLSARDQDYANLIAEITKPVVDKETIASYLGLPTDIPGLQSLSAPSIGAMMDKVGQLAATLASSDPAAFNQWGKFLEHVVTGLGTLNSYNLEYGKTTQALGDAEFSLGEVRREEAKKLSAFAAELASAKSQADIALLKAQGRAEQAAALERENYIASLVDLTAEQVAAKVGAYDYTKAIEQQVAVMQQRQGLEQSIAQALGQTAMLRERELAALDASNRPLQMRLYALSDAATAMDAALAGVQRATDAEKAQISKSAAAQIEALRTGIDAGAKSISDAQGQVGTLSGLFDNIADAVKSLRGNVNPELDLLHARSYIDMSLSLARAGTMPDAAKLRDAISAVGKDTADAYRTMADFEFAQLVQAGKLEKLGSLVGEQKTVQEKQLDSLNTAATLAQDQITAIETARDAQLAALDTQLKASQDQVNVMKGVDISVQSVSASLTGLNGAIQQLASARTQAQVTTLPAATAAGAGASVGTGAVQPAAFDRTAFASAIDAGTVTNAQLASASATYSPGLVYQQLEAVAGRSVADVATVSELYALAEQYHLPGFAAGGMHAGGWRLVGERGPEIEATGPARYWNAADTQQFLGGGGTSARLEQIFEQLLARIEALEQQGNDAKVARAELLRLWDQVTEGGNAIRADIVATSV